MKTWKVKYAHNDGRKGTVNVTTELQKGAGFQYGNGTVGRLTVNDFNQIYDLRYCREKDLHMVMLKEYFGDGLVSATEL